MHLHNKINKLPVWLCSTIVLKSCSCYMALLFSIVLATFTYKFLLLIGGQCDELGLFWQLAQQYSTFVYKWPEILLFGSKNWLTVCMQSHWRFQESYIPITGPTEQCQITFKQTTKFVQLVVQKPVPVWCSWFWLDISHWSYNKRVNMHSMEWPWTSVITSSERVTVVL
jgi:hypothetical protein